MALSENECAVLKALFKYFTDDELRSLAQTVTQNKVVVSKREEAIDAILSFSPTTESILRRKKVKIEYLVKFMFDCGIPMHEKIEKATVIHRFLDNLPRKSLTPSIPPPPPQEERISPPLSSFGAAFAGQFTPWFIQTFNAGPPKFGPQHFWSDAELRLRLVSSQGDLSRDAGAQGASAVSSEMAALYAAGVRLVPAPCGASAEIDAFGRVALKLKGVVHRVVPGGADGGPAGLFQLLLGLMESVPQQDQPEQRSYKIKLLQLELQTSIDLDLRAICS